MNCASVRQLLVALGLLIFAGAFASGVGWCEGEATPVTVIGQGGSPSWSPSGTKLAWWTANGLTVRDMDTGKLTGFQEIHRAQGHAPVWLPDESGVLIVPFGTIQTTKHADYEVTSYQNLNLFLADLATGKATALTDFVDQPSIGKVAVSPDGTLAMLEGPKLGGPYLSESFLRRSNKDGTFTDTPTSVPYAGLWLIDLKTGEREVVM